MTEVTTSARKDDHIRINLERDVQSDGVSTGLERLYFEHQALPEMEMAAVDMALTVFGRKLSAPLLISCMTG
ncbi:MAG: type 2 isopentenyl-diphosphate Delta-isomerase, partial [Anaerolineales bacterium]|nr:type 2 isopentenyl-diphosphate Delta-isomerase [Anaerolineales bacterium]